MKVSSSSGWRRWPLAVAGLALVVPLAMTAGAGGGARASASSAASQATPVVDGSYLYSQLYTMATSFSYRISGADPHRR